MSVASRNPFALLEDEDASRPSSPVSAPAPPKAAAPAPATSARGTQRGRGGPASRGGRYYQRGGKPLRENQDTVDETAAADGEAPKRRFDGEGRGRGRGRGRGDRGGRGGRGRPFDRQSQTGKTDSDKKINQGWGADEGDAELKAENAGATDAAADAFSPAADTSGWGEAATTTDGWAAPTPAAEEVASPEGEKSGEREGRRAREQEEEDNTLTLDEYLKQQKELEIVPKLETRKANEGDDSIWKDAVVVNKKDEDETAYFVGKVYYPAPHLNNECATADSHNYCLDEGFRS
ncbi:hypothetical protein AcW1_000575 [Taiwanofungus camphoratus]|nr:hypothetical protein AcV5_004473 [Antrodia cinnamomea]KAI0961510.1 hypothetical protein AcV7_000593 [Antrodia cinnamomea]KAI0963524.1 hypothetical protein AcW1_000575 [Antrodia cinnamomea]